MCLICDRIELIRKGKNPWFVKELKTGYVVIGDHQHFKGYTLFLCKEHKTELFELEQEVKTKFLEEMATVAEAVSRAFGAEKMNVELLGNGDTHLHWHLFLCIKLSRLSPWMQKYQNQYHTGHKPAYSLTHSKSSVSDEYTFLQNPHTHPGLQNVAHIFFLQYYHYGLLIPERMH